MAEGRSRIAVLFSGGWESTACAVRALERIGPRFDLVFFEYGQPYLEQERVATEALAQLFDVPLRVVRLDDMAVGADGVFKDRNATFIRQAHALGYRELYFGCRLPVRWLDRWGDSNLEFVADMERELRCVIRTPCLCRPKFLLRWYVRAVGPDGAANAVWSSEGWKYEESTGEDAHHAAV